jgi:SAM-dependent methyltransferase
VTAEKSGYACPACASDDTLGFHAQRKIPVNSCLLVNSSQEALDFPTGDLELCACRTCGFVFNGVFSSTASTYSSEYEETQGFSARFNEFARELATSWIDRHDIRGKKIVEIGCGKGEFLALMCEIGGNIGIGVDPSAIPERLVTDADVTLIPEYFDESHITDDVDVVICRHTLEHIAPVGDFMRTVRRCIGDRPNVVVLFELPDVARVLQEAAFWDIYYEHCSYFTAGSLARLFRATGFDVKNVEMGFEGQYILLEAHVGAATTAPLQIEESPADVMRWATEFEDVFTKIIGDWRTELDARKSRGERTILWGGGSKAVSYLTTLSADDVAYAVDINPRKQGRYLAGSGCRVLGPQDLTQEPPNLVVAMNAAYTGEIQAELDRLGVDALLRAV